MINVRTFFYDCYIHFVCKILVPTLENTTFYFHEKPIKFINKVISDTIVKRTYTEEMIYVFGFMITITWWASDYIILSKISI